jgi:hypothetical protein
MFIPDAATFNSRASALVHWPFSVVRNFEELQRQAELT